MRTNYDIIGNHMYLHHIDPVAATFIWKRANRDFKPETVEMTGIWLGTPTAGGQHTFVPVVAAAEPTDDWWGICPSKTFRPKICANRDSRPGWIAKISAKGNDSPITTGQILVDSDLSPLVYLVARGLGTSPYTREQYPEYLLTAQPGAVVTVLHTDGRIVDYNFGKEEVTTHLSSLDPECVYLPFTDPRVPHWNYPTREQE